ncbi:hypothetical protein JB92DRAFT_1057008 [Gautieria morchelliformis]|nr:hypothetical protein JB92DRAFT_1057008 [Gautieria morchelliformis]
MTSFVTVCLVLWASYTLLVQDQILYVPPSVMQHIQLVEHQRRGPNMVRFVVGLVVGEIYLLVSRRFTCSTASSTICEVSSSAFKFLRRIAFGIGEVVDQAWTFLNHRLMDGSSWKNCLVLMDIVSSGTVFDGVLVT